MIGHEGRRLYRENKASWCETRLVGRAAVGNSPDHVMGGWYKTGKREREMTRGRVFANKNRKGSRRDCVGFAVFFFSFRVCFQFSDNLILGLCTNAVHLRLGHGKLRVWALGGAAPGWCTATAEM